MENATEHALIHFHRRLGSIFPVIDERKYVLQTGEY